MNKNHLNINHYICPGIFYETMKTKQLQETLLATDGTILACGKVWDITSKKTGPGIYKVWLENFFDKQFKKEI